MVGMHSATDLEHIEKRPGSWKVISMSVDYRGMISKICFRSVILNS